MSSEKTSVRFYDKNDRESVILPLSDDFKKNFLEKATFMPYPIILKRKDHYIILHLDAEFKDRGTVITDIFVDMDKLENS